MRRSVGPRLGSVEATGWLARPASNSHARSPPRPAPPPPPPLQLLPNPLRSSPLTLGVLSVPFSAHSRLSAPPEITRLTTPRGVVFGTEEVRLGREPPAPQPACPVRAYPETGEEPHL